MLFEIKKEEVRKFDMSIFLPYLNDLYKSRFTSKKEHYQLLAWIANAYPPGRVFDLGTRAGASAMCFASNPENEVWSYDISSSFRKENNFDFSKFPNIDFIKGDATEIVAKNFSEASLIMLDLLHRGNEEQTVIDTINYSGFSGLLILDDIDFYKFPKMRDVWAGIKKPKWTIPFGHHSGTGIVSYGPEVIVSE